MLIPVNDPILRFDYAGVNIFPVDWPFYGLSSIQVIATDKQTVNPIMEYLAYGTDYTVVGILASALDSPEAYSRGEVTLTTAGIAKIPTTDPVIVVYRETTPEQEYKYTELDNFPALSHENALGKSIALIQEIQDTLTRCIKAPLGANTTGDQYINDLLEAITQIADINAQLEEIRLLVIQAAAFASNSATSASQASASSSSAGTSASQAALSANSAASSAAKILALTASAITLPAGSNATASYNSSTGNMAFGIPQGIKGDKGDTGTGIKPLGKVNTVAQLPATGSAGDGWLVGATMPYNLYIWDTNMLAWVNTGPLQGEQGPQGPTGAQGPTGSVGPQGPAGPAGTTNTGVVTTITASGSFSAAANSKYLVEVWAGGGAGSSLTGAANCLATVGGGGSSGGYLNKILKFTSETIIPITIGMGGIASLTSATHGGDSSFGSYIIAKGGITADKSDAVANMLLCLPGGSSSGPGSNPGCDAIIHRSNITATTGRSGDGGSSLVGTPGLGVISNPKTSAAGNPASGYNAGGSGAAVSGALSQLGGNGAPGIVIITRLV